MIYMLRTMKWTKKIWWSGLSAQKKTGFIQNIIHCLNIKNLQYIFLMILKKKSNWEGGWLGRDPNWKIPIRFDSFLKPSLSKVLHKTGAYTIK